MKKRVQITEQICKQAQLMKKGGANQTEIGKLLGLNPSTVSRMETAGFDMETYEKQRRERRQRDVQRAEKREQATYEMKDTSNTYEGTAEEQLPGQMKMELPVKDAEEQTKMMRFQAAQVDKLSLKLDHLNDTLSMILRAVRKE